MMLCDICKAFSVNVDDFLPSKERIINQRGWLDRVGVGSIAAIRSRSKRCTLCNLLIATLNAENTIHCSLNASECQRSVQLYWSPPTCAQNPGIRISELCVTYRGDTIPSLNHKNRISLHADSRPTQSSSLLLGRDVPSIIDIGRFRSWLDSCRRWHGTDCGRSGHPQVITPFAISQSTKTRALRVIDCHSMCLAEVPFTEQFLALSYVWGIKPVFKLLQRDLKTLCEAGALRHFWKEIPLTIRDAVDLTKALGIQHIWVDSLCIVQDDPSDKAYWIPRMDLIYMRAFLTIIAASGEASTGLSGLSIERIPQTKAKLDKDMTVIVRGNVTQMLLESKYDLRAWV